MQVRRDFRPSETAISYKKPKINNAAAELEETAPFGALQQQQQSTQQQSVAVNEKEN